MKLLVFSVFYSNDDFSKLRHVGYTMKITDMFFIDFVNFKMSAQSCHFLPKPFSLILGSGGLLLFVLIDRRLKN
jgi:hypothetical protein